MSTANDLQLIEQVTCPACNAKPRVHCVNRRSKETGTRIWPWNEGSAGPTWVHEERRNLAIEKGLIKP